jgi:triosephosphate isomerase
MKLCRCAIIELMKKLIIANWKMNPQSVKEVEGLFKSVMNGVKTAKNTQVVVCPPFPYLYIAKKFKSQKVVLGAQDVFQESAGAHTGEVSAGMLANLGVKYVIIGHSDRRAQGDTNHIVSQKVMNALKEGMKPLLCVGEQSRDEHGVYLAFIQTQLHECLAGVSKAQIQNVIIAYEPIWSISTTPNSQEDTPADCLEMTIFIRKVLSDMCGASTAKDIYILYGGSVNEKNFSDFIIHGGADGLLVGRASLDVKKFNKIIGTDK